MREEKKERGSRRSVFCVCVGEDGSLGPRLNPCAL